MNSIVKQESAVSVFGVPARAFNVVAEDSGLIRNQKIIATRAYREGKNDCTIAVSLRFDDECKNGHETFSITGEIRRNGREDSCGCIHDDIAKRFPELAHLIKWHLFSTDGPMHYIANTVYHASNRDHNGLLAGAPSAYDYGVRFGDSPVTHRIGKAFYTFLEARYQDTGFQCAAKFIRAEFAHDRDPKTYGAHYSVQGFADKWHECPFRDITEADEFIAGLNNCAVEFVRVPSQFSQGKARELDHARSTAVWPEATDAELCADTLKKALLARLPALIARFKADMLAVGFVYPKD